MSGKAGRPNKLFLESDIRRAMDNTISNGAAARFLGTTLKTYRKYAKMYFDEDGVDLYEKHKNITGKGVKRTGVRLGGEKYSLQDVFDGKSPRYPLSKLKDKLFHEAYKAEECENCGFCERRVTDYSVPLILHQKDKDKSNYSLDNLEVLCYNCYYLYVGSVTVSNLQTREVTKAKEVKDQLDDDLYDYLRSL